MCIYVESYVHAVQILNVTVLVTDVGHMKRLLFLRHVRHRVLYRRSEVLTTIRTALYAPKEVTHLKKSVTKNTVGRYTQNSKNVTAENVTAETAFCNRFL